MHDSPIKPEEVAMEPAEDAHDLLEAKQKGNYRITTVFKVEIDIIANISASPMGHAWIFVICLSRPSELTLFFFNQ